MCWGDIVVYKCCDSPRARHRFDEKPLSLIVKFRRQKADAGYVPAWVGK
jgi:hypothetical protein